MANFDEAYRILIPNEGGYANRANDKGGETYQGISRKWWPDWSGWIIIDAIKAVRALKHNEVIHDANLKIAVKNFYKKNFWNKLQGDKINDQSIANIMFDLMVMVDDDAVKIAQRILTRIGLYKYLVDGKIGKHSISALNTVPADWFFYEYKAAREAFHRAVAKADPVFGAPNLDGWLNRLNKAFAVYVKKKDTGLSIIALAGLALAAYQLFQINQTSKK